MMLLGFADQSTTSPAAVATPPSPHATHPLLVAAMPWVISILLHAGVVLVLVFTVFTIHSMSGPAGQETIIPDARWSDTPGMPMGVISEKINLGGGNETRSIENRNTQPLTQIGAGGRGTGAGKESGAGSGAAIGDLIGSTAGAGGGPAGQNPFALGPGHGQASGPFRTQFVGSGGNARDIAYVIDASGSLIDTLPFVLNELRSSIDGLNEQQTFTVVFFQDGLVLEPPGGGKRPATFQNKEKLYRWLATPGSVSPSGRTQPLPAIRKALSYQPQLLYLLSDNITGQGQYEVRQEELVDAIAKANTGKTAINTIQFLTDDPLVKFGKKRTMELIAQQSGGHAKFVSAAELGIEEATVLKGE